MGDLRYFTQISLLLHIGISSLMLSVPFTLSARCTDRYRYVCQIFIALITGLVESQANELSI